MACVDVIGVSDIGITCSKILNVSILSRLAQHVYEVSE